MLLIDSSVCHQELDMHYIRVKMYIVPILPSSDQIRIPSSPASIPSSTLSICFLHDKQLNGLYEVDKLSFERRRNTERVFHLIRISN